MSGQETTDVRLTIDESSLSQYLAKAITGWAGPLEVRQFGFGQSNPTYLLTDSGTRKQYVLRKKPAGKLIKGAHAVEREVRVISAFSDTAVPVPKVHVLCEDTTVLGTPFYIMEFCEGRIFTDSSMPGEMPKTRTKCYALAAETLAKLHSCDFRAIGLEGFGKAAQYYNRQTKTMSKVHKLQASRGADSIANFDAIAEWLRANQPPDLTSVVHGDYKLDNLVFHPTEPRVIAILDWEMSTIGHPRADLGNFIGSTYLPMLQTGKDLQELGIPSQDEFVAMYYKHIQQPHPDPWWPFHRTFYFFKTCVILQGIQMRFKQGVASSGSAKKYSSYFPIYVQLLLAQLSELEAHLKAQGLLKTSLPKPAPKAHL